MKKIWRPAFAAVFIAFYAATAATILTLLILEETTLADASSVLVTMLGMGATVIGVYTAGRSHEKRHGKDG